MYYGKRVSIDSSYLYLINTINRPLTSFVDNSKDFISMQHLRQEYATFGFGDNLLPAYTIEQKDGTTLSNFIFKSYHIYRGKKNIQGLPQTYTTENQNADSLILTLKDEVSGTLLYLKYTIFDKMPVITRSSEFVQYKDEHIRLSRALSMNLDLPDCDYDWIHLDGAWARERDFHCDSLHYGIQSIYSMKGISSSEHNPFLALKRKTADEFNGEVIGFSLIYSGNFLAQIDVTTFQKMRVSMGINPEKFNWELSKGDTFQTPEVVIVYSDRGLNYLSHVFHNLFNNNLVRGIWKNSLRPILINNWESMGFDFDENKLLLLAERASEIGIELFVLDDGWFGKRNNDSSSLGDWVVNKGKLPSGIDGISKKIHNLKMKFGLWIEPEMVNKDSELYREHPDWILHHPKYYSSPSRNQYVLDLTRDDVFDNIYNQLEKLLLNNKIDYIKWDMNRYLTEVFSIKYSSEKQGEIYHRYILNLYKLYEKLTTKFPTILFESCASGGARFDPGMLYYAPQTWTSDNTDAIERLKIQYGTSIIYPLSTMGCHVSDIPNQQTRRNIPLSTRANVALFGNFGYELDLVNLSNEEIDTIRSQIYFYKRYREVLQFGKFYRLLSPFESDVCAWQVSSRNNEVVIVGYYKILIRANESENRLKLQSLEDDAIYELNHRYYTGSELTHIGLIVDVDVFDKNYFDFKSELFVLTKVKSD